MRKNIFSKVIVIFIGMTCSTPLLASNQEAFDRVVTLHRAMLVLLDKSPSNDPLAEPVFAARSAYVLKRELTEQLIEQAEHEAAASGGNKLTTTTSDLIEFLTKTSALHDGDWLGFGDLLDELKAIESENTQASTELAEFTKIEERYNRVLDRYRKDYGKALDKLAMRGEQHEAWEQYIEFIKGEYEYESLLKLYGHDSSQLTRTATRGDGDSKSKSDELKEGMPKVIWGNSIPDKTVVLTFDDGPHFRNTPKILDILKAHQVNAYFFSVGKNLGTVADQNAKLGKNEPIAMRIVKEKHILANHSYTHTILTKLDKKLRSDEINKTNLLLTKASGSKNKLFRPPFGSTDHDLDMLTMQDGMVSVMWNIDSMDWADPIPESIVDRTMRELDKHKKGILLFHDIHKQTVDALPDILLALARQGYRVVTLDGMTFNENQSGLPKVQADSNSQLYGKSWAVVIGINKYQYWPKLEYAVNDAREVAKTLQSKLGFSQENIITLFDDEATSERITDVLGYQLADPKRIAENDRIFVFYAGHGMTRTMPNGKALGYIIPVDAEVDKFQNRAISMTQLSDFSSMIPAKHAYFVMDSCYSGLALTRAGVSVGQSSNYISQITNRRARQILTAGGADQEVADGGPGGHSIFTWTLLQGLDGLADTDNNGYVTASELGTYVAPVVSSYSSQTPAFGNLLGSEGGDFVFKVDAGALAEINTKLSDDAKRIEDELTSLRKATNDNVRRRLELELEIAKQKSGNLLPENRLANSEPGKVAAAVPAIDPAVANNLPIATKSLPSGETIESERTKQAKRLNASALEYFKEKKYKEAKEELAEAVRLNPYNQTIVNNYGYMLDQLNENEEALKWYYRTVEINPRRTAVYMNLGDIMVELGRPQEAIPYYERYLHLYPSYKDAKLLREKIEQYKAVEAKQ